VVSQDAPAAHAAATTRNGANQAPRTPITNPAPNPVPGQHIGDPTVTIQADPEPAARSVTQPLLTRSRPAPTPTRDLTPGISATHTATPETVIDVSIGRIEIHPVAPAAAGTTRKGTEPPITLADYLRERRAAR
jgi:hypothetical protein